MIIDIEQYENFYDDWKEVSLKAFECVNAYKCNVESDKIQQMKLFISGVETSWHNDDFDSTKQTILENLDVVIGVVDSMWTQAEGLYIELNGVMSPFNSSIDNLRNEYVNNKPKEHDYRKTRYETDEFGGRRAAGTEFDSSAYDSAVSKWKKKCKALKAVCDEYVEQIESIKAELEGLNETGYSVGIVVAGGRTLGFDEDWLRNFTHFNQGEGGKTWWDLDQNMSAGGCSVTSITNAIILAFGGDKSGLKLNDFNKLFGKFGTKVLGGSRIEEVANCPKLFGLDTYQVPKGSKDDVDNIFQSINDGKGVAVFRIAEGNWGSKNGHYVTIAATRKNPKTGEWEAYIMDPAGGKRDGWVSQSKLQSSGHSQNTYTFVNSSKTNQELTDYFDNPVAI